MPETIEYEEFEATGDAGTPAASGSADLSRLSDIPMELSVELGRSHMTVGQTLELRVGAVVALERQAGEPADLLVNGSPIARGEIVVVEEQYGLRITEILDEPQQPPLAGVPGAGEEQPPDTVAEPAATGEEA
ncbi:MAG TPA: flagellar motor switch protein FliN [Solirubrobacteraceae bacterium]|nr:flagellar motor switch protein FliN [Solirubrobacteraceae bacterium]